VNVGVLVPGAVRGRLSRQIVLSHDVGGDGGEERAEEWRTISVVASGLANERMTGLRRGGVATGV